jgi:hypothetical protein
MDDLNNTGLWPDDGIFIFVSDDLYHSVHRVLSYLEQAADALKEVRNEKII